MNKYYCIPSRACVCIYISVLFVYTRSSSTAYTYTRECCCCCSETEGFGFVNKCLALLARCTLGFLLVVIDSPGVGSGSRTATLLHLPYFLHLLFLHGLHHQVLLPHHHRGDSHCHSLDQSQDQSTDQCILECH